MKKILGFLKNKYFKMSLFLLIGFSLITMIIYGISLIMPDTDESLYGSRLEGIENFDISDQRLDLIIDKIEEKDFVETVSFNIQGRIINFIVYVETETALLLSKALSEVLLEELDDEEKGFFDFQLFLTTEEESELYPKIGYKSSNSVNFVWTN